MRERQQRKGNFGKQQLKNRRLEARLMLVPENQLLGMETHCGGGQGVPERGLWKRPGP